MLVRACLFDLYDGGVKRFCIYDDGSEALVSRPIPAGSAGRVTVVDFPPLRQSTRMEPYGGWLYNS